MDKSAWRSQGASVEVGIGKTIEAGLVVQELLLRHGARTPLKTEESRRVIDIPPALMRRLLALVDQRGSRFNRQAFVFASRNGTGLERKVARRLLDRAVKAARLDAPKPTLHDLRHSHASMLIAHDYNLVEIQRRLGHRKPDTTLKVYAHEWKYRQAQRSQIGAQLGLLFSADGAAKRPEQVESRVLTASRPGSADAQP